MTTIAALHVQGWGTVVGSDSQLTTGTQVSYTPHAIFKLVRHGGWVIATAGAIRTRDLLELHKAALFDGLASAEQLPARLESLLCECDYHRDHGDCGGPGSFNQRFLLASAEGLWKLDPTLALLPCPPGVLIGLGSGEEYAMGSGFATQRVRDPMKRVQAAIEAASYFDGMTGGGIGLIALKSPASSEKVS